MRNPFATLTVLVFLGGCATAPGGENDPFERLNRATFNFNRTVEHALLRPAAATYRTVLPSPLRHGVANALANLKTPVVLANDLMQGEGRRAGDTLGRFLVNTTIGVGGLFDPASGMGLPYHDEDFGQTLAVWGVGEGAYLELPLLGPSNVRDAFGLAGTTAMDPVFWIVRDSDVTYLNYARRGVEGIDLLNRNRATLDDMERTSLDYYAAMRSLYRQDRQAEIANGHDDLPDIPDYFEDETP